MEKSARYAEKQSTTSEDATNAQTADGANANEHITKPLIYLGLENGLINIVSLKSIYDDGSDGLVCRIGEYWFFFDGEKADNAKSITSYFIQTPIFMLVDNIYNSLEDISKIKENETEYKYYYWYLIEKLRCMEEKQ